MDKHETAEETAAGVEKREAPDGRMENAADVGIPISEVVHSTSLAARQGPVGPNESTTDTEPPASFTPPLSMSFPPGGSEISAEKAVPQGFSDGSVTDTNCLICVNQYSLSRLPKLLACQHVFCAVCLKLLVHHEGDAWRISCPVCRKATTVFGGLVCSLRTKEEAFQGSLPNPGPNGEAAFSLDAQGAKHQPHSIFYIDPDVEVSNNNRVATKRLLFLLLLLVFLVILALPFLYAGLLKWALCFAVGWGLAMSGVLCWNPNSCAAAQTFPSHPGQREPSTSHSPSEKF
ncbi:E3 ubiquitin-protein ligase RNF186 [Elgaria multicarinata webbii]|uniref:E3 ubiquitin-protein ligase RNF186 n=1 Tax=Elgaria multicarinata webbii TaxID=159646 RepID=UPI002FCD568B